MAPRQDMRKFIRAKDKQQGKQQFLEEIERIQKSSQSKPSEIRAELTSLKTDKKGFGFVPRIIPFLGMILLIFISWFFPKDYLSKIFSPDRITLAFLYAPQVAWAGSGPQVFKVEVQRYEQPVEGNVQVEFLLKSSDGRIIEQSSITTKQGIAMYSFDPTGMSGTLQLLAIAEGERQEVKFNILDIRLSTDTDEIALDPGKPSTLSIKLVNNSESPSGKIYCSFTFPSGINVTDNAWSVDPISPMDFISHKIYLRAGNDFPTENSRLQVVCKDLDSNHIIGVEQINLHVNWIYELVSDPQKIHVPIDGFTNVVPFRVNIKLGPNPASDDTVIEILSTTTGILSLEQFTPLGSGSFETSLAFNGKDNGGDSIVLKINGQQFLIPLVYDHLSKGSILIGSFFDSSSSDPGAGFERIKVIENQLLPVEIYPDNYSENGMLRIVTSIYIEKDAILTSDQATINWNNDWLATHSPLPIFVWEGDQAVEVGYLYSPQTLPFDNYIINASEHSDYLLIAIRGWVTVTNLESGG
jgi:hypothetical protein